MVWTITSTSFLLHNSLNIILISLLNVPYISFLLNFGANTIWYLHPHVVCAKLSAYGFSIHPTSFHDYILSRQTLNIISCRSRIFCYSVQNYKFYYTSQLCWGYSKFKSIDSSIYYCLYPPI